MPACLTGWLAGCHVADPSKDIAVLQLDAPKEVLRSLTPVQLGDSDRLLVGQSVYAIGNPFGLDHTLTTGVISGLNRELFTGVGPSLRNVLQISAGATGRHACTRKSRRPCPRQACATVWGPSNRRCLPAPRTARHQPRQQRRPTLGQQGKADRHQLRDSRSHREGKVSCRAACCCCACCAA
jgi:hypothetical protein